MTASCAFFQPKSGPVKAIDAVTFSPDGKTLAAGSADGGVQLWDVSHPGKATALTGLTSTNGAVISAAFSDSGTLAASSADGSIHLWDVRDPAAPTALVTLSGLANPTSVAWRPGARTLVGAAADGTPLSWNINADDIVHRICASSYLAGSARSVITPYLRGITYQPVCR